MRYFMKVLEREKSEMAKDELCALVGGQANETGFKTLLRDLRSGVRWGSLSIGRAPVETVPQRIPFHTRTYSERSGIQRKGTKPTCTKGKSLVL